jgi:uncharacterized repeat protein (TIGR01451 family)
LAIAVTFGPGVRLGAAIEVPPVGGFYIQTSGPNTAVTIGDWYTATSAGAGSGHHYVEVTIPCGWPALVPLHFDLFSPEMNNVAGSLGIGDEVRNSYDTTEFELYGPGATVGPGYANPAPGTGIAGTQDTFAPGAPAVAETWVRWVTLSPVACGRYLVRSAVLVAPDGDDDNGWRLRVGSDNDGDPTNAPPANSDNADGIPGTNDELIVGQFQISYQQSTGGVACLTLYEYIPAGLSSVTMNNFDMDGNTRVTYYAPSDAYDPTGLTGGTPGTLSTNGQWNNGTIARGGDVIATPEQGWWRVVSCLGPTNQFIQEAQAGIGAYSGQPPVPSMAAFKTDNTTQTAPGGALDYVVTVLNTATGPTAGAALQVVITDALPPGVTFTGCEIVAPATGTCSESAGVVTASLNGWINAGAGAQIVIHVTVNPGATGTLSDLATVSYTDALGNPFPPVTASDTDTVVMPPALPNTATAGPVEALGLAAGLLVAVALIADVNLRSNRRRELGI